MIVRTRLTSQVPRVMYPVPMGIGEVNASRSAVTVSDFRSTRPKLRPEPSTSFITPSL